MLTRISRIVLVIGLIIGGVWLATRTARPALEGSARVQAVQLAAPGVRVAAGANNQPVPELAIAQPVTVDLSTIPAGVLDPNNQYDRWQRGEIDLLENENILPPAEMAALRHAAMNLPPSSRISPAAPADGVAPNAPAAGARRGWATWRR